MRILVTNDDGIDSVGLHELARIMIDLGEITVVAPDQEYSGFGAALGPVHLIRPEVHRARIEGIETVWAVSGPPALCVMYANLGVFGKPFDLVVAGINPGSNVGRSVYHSGTVGAALTARNGGTSGVAVSQAVSEWGVEGQGMDEVLDQQLWGTAAEVAYTAVSALITDLPPNPVVLNINVPNLPTNQVRGWRFTQVGGPPPRTMASAKLEPKPGHEESFRVKMSWGDPAKLPTESDGGAVMADFVSLTWLGGLAAECCNDAHGVGAALERMMADTKNPGPLL